MNAIFHGFSSHVDLFTKFKHVWTFLSTKFSLADIYKIMYITLNSLLRLSSNIWFIDNYYIYYIWVRGCNIISLTVPYFCWYSIPFLLVLSIQYIIPSFTLNGLSYTLRWSRVVEMETFGLYFTDLTFYFRSLKQLSRLIDLLIWGFNYRFISRFWLVLCYKILLFLK